MHQPPAPNRATRPYDLRREGEYAFLQHLVLCFGTDLMYMY